MAGIDLFRIEGSETDDSGDLQTIKGQGYAGEELIGVHRVSHFGMHSVAPPGSHSLGLALRGQRSLVAALGLEHPTYRPRNREVGSTVIYDMHNNVVSLVKREIRIVHATSIVIEAPEIVLNGTVYLGGKDGAKPASMQGTTDTRGDADVGNLATKVFVK